MNESNGTPGVFRFGLDTYERRILELDAEVERLEAENAKLRTEAKCCRACPEQPSTLVTELRDEADRLRAERDRLREVLKPFIAAIHKIRATYSHYRVAGPGTHWNVVVTTAELEAAAEAVEGGEHG